MKKTLRSIWKWILIKSVIVEKQTALNQTKRTIIIDYVCTLLQEKIHWTLKNWGNGISEPVQCSFIFLQVTIQQFSRFPRRNYTQNFSVRQKRNIFLSVYIVWFEFSLCTKERKIPKKNAERNEKKHKLFEHIKAREKLWKNINFLF